MSHGLGGFSESVGEHYADLRRELSPQLMAKAYRGVIEAGTDFERRRLQRGVRFNTGL